MSPFHIIHIIICVLLTAVVLFQDGKAGGLTSVSDSSQSVFGARGATSFLTRATTFLAVCFMLSCLFLTFSGPDGNKSITSGKMPVVETKTDTTSVKAPEGDKSAAPAVATPSDAATTPAPSDAATTPAPSDAATTPAPADAAPATPEAAAPAAEEKSADQ